MKELVYMKKKVMVIQCDNQGAISLTNNTTQHAQTKHIVVQHQFVRRWMQGIVAHFVGHNSKFYKVQHV
jgi:hypothetical protein